MKKISWITCDSYLDTDLPIVSHLLNHYRIRCIVVVSLDNSIDYENMVRNELSGSENAEIEFVYIRHRLRSLRNLPDYYRIIRKAKNYNPDIYYVSYQGMPYAPVMYRMMLPTNKCIAPCHNVSTPSGATNEKLAAKTTRWWINSFMNINVFSLSQKECLHTSYPHKRILYAPFFLKSYGSARRKVDKLNSRPIRFLLFGNIVKYKRIDLLIGAANILSDSGITEFIVRIAGNCKNWEDYRKCIRYPERFELIIKRIPNEEVAALFEDSHYLILPYQDIAQSGAMAVAFNYNVPTIVSDIPQFREFVKNGVTGLCFKSEDAHSLADVMQYCIKDHYKVYESLCSNQREFVARHYDNDEIVKRYRMFFDNM